MLQEENKQNNHTDELNNNTWRALFLTVQNREMKHLKNRQKMTIFMRDLLAIPTQYYWQWILQNIIKSCIRLLGKIKHLLVQSKIFASPTIYCDKVRPDICKLIKAFGLDKETTKQKKNDILSKQILMHYPLKIQL